MIEKYWDGYGQEQLWHTDHRWMDEWMDELNWFFAYDVNSGKLRTTLIIFTCISLPTGTNGKLLAAIGKFSITIGKLIIGKALATNGEEITNAMIDNNILAIYW